MAVSFQGFRSLVENNPDAISLIDRRGEILYGSASSSRIFGYQPEEIVGRNCLDLIHPEDRDQSHRALKQVVAMPPGPFQSDGRVRHKDGTYCWVESTFSNLLFEPEVQAIVIQQRDINARRAAEAEARQRADELTRSNLRLEEFARVAAHDLREPLLSISLYTELLAHKSQMDANARQMAQIILDGAARVTALVDGLLSFANTGMHEPARSINLLRAFEQAAKNLAVPLKTSGAQITVGRLPVVESKEIQLVSLFQNLISNAVKYRREAPLEIQVAAERRGPYWVVKVADNGSGIPQRTNFGSLCPSCGWPAARRSAAVSAWRFVRRSWRNWAARSGSNPNWEQDRHSVLPLWRRAGLWLPRSADELAQDGAQLRLCALMLA